MFHDSWFFMGMHLFWWLFWIAAIVAVFSLWTPFPRHKAREMPLEVLQRRYAAGEISSQEYEERRAQLERDEPWTTYRRSGVLSEGGSDKNKAKT